MRLIDADNLDKRIYEEIPLKEFGTVKRMARMREIIAEEPTVGGWISVKERLPDHSCTVLTYHDHGGMQILDYSKKHKLFNCYDWDKKAELDKHKIESVTHWMPAPEPPKED